MIGDQIEAGALDPQLVRGWFDTYIECKCICVYCGFDGGRTPEDWAQLQGDHLIPRRVAAEYAEEPLNRVIACYYCNTVKRDFDPANGKFRRVGDREIQMELIRAARLEIEARKARTWRYAGGFEASYLFMRDRMTSGVEEVLV